MVRSLKIAANAILLMSAPAWAAASGPSLDKAVPCDPLHLIPNCVSVSGPITPDLNDLWQKIIAAAQPDLIYAKALADSANTPGSKLRSRCLAAIIAANTQASGVNLKNPDGSPMVKPSPAIITAVEELAELIDQLQPTAPVISECAAAANAVKMGTVQFISTFLVGVALVPK